MKRIKAVFALIFAVTLICCTGATAFAQTPAEKDALDVSSVVYEVSKEDFASERDTMAALEKAVPGASNSAEEPVQEAQDEEMLAEQQDEPQRKSNTPYFVGAGFAVLIFIGVAVVCKIKGRN